MLLTLKRTSYSHYVLQNLLLIIIPFYKVSLCHEWHSKMLSFWSVFTFCKAGADWQINCCVLFDIISSEDHLMN